MPPVETLKRLFQIKSTTAVKPALSTEVNPRRIMAYGDRLNDGALQLSFTLPVEAGSQAKEAARLYVEKLGLIDAHVATMESMGMGFTYFVVFARATHAIDFTKVKTPKAAFESMDFDQINDFAHEKIQRRLVVVGATTGTDAHTVGIDAIMNMKGYDGDYGLERYPCFKAVNLRSQVSHEDLLRKAAELKADVLLVSKLVTQRGEYQNELKDLVKAIKADKRLNVPLLKIVGGPRLTHAEAVKLGFDAGFGPGTLPSEVASFIVQEYAKRMKR